MNHILCKSVAMNADLQWAVLSAQRLYSSVITWKIHERKKAGSGGRGEEIFIPWRKWNSPGGGALKRGKLKVSHETGLWAVSQILFPGKQILRWRFTSR